MQDYVLANGLKIFYQRSDPKPEQAAIVLLHGFTDNGSCWTRVANDLKATYEVIMPDARAHGRTTRALGNFSYDLLAEDVLSFIRVLGLERPFLFGHSMGALTALLAAAKSPNLVRGIILEDPPFWDDQQVAAVDVQNMQKAAEEGAAFQKLPLAERMAACRASDPGWAEDEIGPWAESKGEYDPELLLPPIRTSMHQATWRLAAAQVACPVLLITANPTKGGIVTPAIASEAEALITACEIVQIPAAGHCIHRDAYAETMQVVHAFLARN